MAAAFYFKISGLEWVALILCIGFVFALEIINSAIENLADFVEPNRHEAIKKIKAAGKVAGILTAHEELIQQSAEAGADFIGIGVDTLLLGEALRQRAASRP